MEYDVVLAESLPELIRVVNELIRVGWAPHGGVSINRVLISWENGDGSEQQTIQTMLIQAMVRQTVAGESL